MVLDVDLRAAGAKPELGASVALAGVCCTVVGMVGSVARFDLSGETLRRTRLGALAVGDSLNLEHALRAGDPLGGHLVQGHVDAVGRVVQSIDPELGGDLVVEVPANLDRYCVEKGSITVDGVSLTIASLEGLRLTFAIIPHTARITTLGATGVGATVNLEVDVIGKYVERMLAPRLGQG